jgi:quinol monooxygenase YgiN
MRPLAGREAEAGQLNLELVEHYRLQPGCLQSTLIHATDDSGEMGRVSFWESEAAADAAANTDRSMLLRSRLHRMVRRGHQDRSFRSE